MEEDLPRLRKEFHEKKGELTELRSQLAAVNKEKEDLYHQLKSVHESIKQNTSQLKPLREERDSLTKKVKLLKEEREQQHKAVQQKSDQKHQAEEKKKSLHREMPFRETPHRIKAQIEHLEMKIVTDALPFDKEQQLTKLIKELKGKLKQVQELITTGKEMNTISAEMSRSRRTAQEIHELVQETARQGQERHEKINAIYAAVKEARAQEKPLAEKYIQLKGQYQDIKKKMDEAQSRYTELSKIFRQQEEKSFKVQVQEKTALVQEKLKKGKKLSTEDILAFQATKE